MADYIRFYIYKWDSNTKKWIYSTKYVDWEWKPMTLNTSHSVAWRSRSSGTKRYKVFRWKSRQETSITLSGRARTWLMRQLEWMTKSKVVVHLRGRYSEPGRPEDEYPVISSILPWDGEGTMPDPGIFGTGGLEYDDYAYYLITNLTVTSTGYIAAAHTQTPSTARELFHEVTLTLDRVDPNKVTSGGYMP